MAETRPTGMRIQRPYATEDEFVRGDGLTIGRMGMILLGAPPRPPGIIIRFEIVLADGQPVFRGEGKVVAHRVHANGRKGLEVKFTKLDSHSKGVVERALELRRSGALTPSPMVTTIPDLTPSPAPSQSAQAASGVSIEHSGTDASPPPEQEPHKQQPSRLELELEEGPNTDPAPAPPQAASETQPAPPPASERPPAVEAPRPESDPPAIEVQETPDDDAPDKPPAVPSEPPAIEVREEALPFGIPPVEDSGQFAADELAAQVELIERAAVDEDPTPFAPPVMFDSSNAPPAAHAAPTTPVATDSSDVRTELDKLRNRHVTVAAPQGRESLLDKLRNRRKST